MTKHRKGFFLNPNLMKTYLCGLLAMTLLLGCKQQNSKTTPTSTQPKHTFVLVHSAWLGSWQWEAVKKELETAGHQVITPDLPGHGASKKLASEILMDDYVNTLTQVLDSQLEPVILVGHSFNGVTVSRATELRPYKVKSLVYLTAFLVPNGVSFFQAVQGVEGSKAVDNFYLSEDQTQAFVKNSEIHQAFAHDIPLEVFEKVASKIVPEPAAPLAYALEITDEQWGQVPKYYIECTLDKAIPVAVQRAMYTNNVAEVFSLEASYTPNFSKPKELSDILLKIAQSVE